MAVALKQSSDIFMNKLQSTASSDAELPATLNKPTAVNPSSPRVAYLSSPRMHFPSPPRVPIALESVRELRAKKCDLNRSLRDNHQVNHMCKDVELSHQTNTVLSEYG